MMRKIGAKGIALAIGTQRSARIENPNWSVDCWNKDDRMRFLQVSPEFL